MDLREIGKLRSSSFTLCRNEGFGPREGISVVVRLVVYSLDLKYKMRRDGERRVLVACQDS